MAAKIFHIVGTVALGIFIIMILFLLPIVSRFLKKLNRRLEQRKVDLGGELRKSLTGIDGARNQVEMLTSSTLGLKKTLERAIGAADASVKFLNSNTFQIGLPAFLWALFFAVAFPRSLRKKKRRRRFEPVPPPSS